MTKREITTRVGWLKTLKLKAHVTSEIAAKRWGVSVVTARHRLKVLHKLGWVAQVSRIMYPVPLYVVWRLGAKGARVCCLA